MRRGFTLVSTLVTIALIGGLAAVFMFGGFGPGDSSRKDKLGKTIPGQVMLRAKDEKCRHNLDQCRKSLVILFQGADDEYTPTLAETKMPADMMRCVIGDKEPYVYDPSTYRSDSDLKKLVRCPHPGHEKY